MIKSSKQHLQSVNETYFEHQGVAFRYGWKCLKASAMAFLHGLVPGWYKAGASDLVKQLSMSRGGKRDPVPGTATAQPEIPADCVFTTARLTVRRWRDSDHAALLAVYGDLDAMRWVGDGRALTSDECGQWLEVTRRNYQQRGYGMFAVEMRRTGEVVGFCGLVHPGGQAEPEAKYAYARDYWGQGIATEVLAGLLNYGAAVHQLRHIIATADPENIASHRVLEKSGMQKGALQDNEDGTRTQWFDWRADDAPHDPAR